MKANEAPEKIYISTNSQDGTYYISNQYKRLIEYVHKDSFIEKACKWIKEFNNHHYIMRYSDSCEPPLSEVTEWFKNYMKGE